MGRTAIDALSGTMPVGRVFSISVRLHWSWFLTLVLVPAVLSARYFPDRLPGAARPELWLLGLVAAFGLFGTVLLHELSHALMARRFGLGIAGITLHALGGVTHLDREPDSPRADLLIALVGPFSSFVIATVCGIAQGAGTAAPAVRATLAYLAAVNGAAALLNLVPGLPLDGGRLLRAVLWRRWRDRAWATWRASQLGAVFGWLLTAVGTVVLVGGGPLAGVSFMLVGVVLQVAALTGARPAPLRHALERVRVETVMVPDVEVIPASATLDRLAIHQLSTSPSASRPVGSSGRVVGIITVRQVISVPRERWPTTPVGRVMLALRDDLTIPPSGSCWDALRKLRRNRVGHLVVLDGDRLVGSLTKRDLAPVLICAARGRPRALRRLTNTSPADDTCQARG
jgi:Zn-dependent protease/CBS domain-containing protein